MPRNPQKPQVDELERTIAELEQRVARLTALHRVAQSMATTPTASRVLVELARELGTAIPRVCEVSVSEWDRRRGVIRDIFEFNPRLHGRDRSGDFILRHHLLHRGTDTGQYRFGCNSGADEANGGGEGDK